jgi:hypothetical protein
LFLRRRHLGSGRYQGHASTGIREVDDVHYARFKAHFDHPQHLRDLQYFADFWIEEVFQHGRPRGLEIERRLLRYLRADEPQFFATKTSDDDYDYKMKSAKAQAADDAALVKNAKEAYAEVSTAAERRAGFIGQRQKLAKLIVTKWLEPPLGPAARALKTLADVPLSIESNCTWMYDRSLAEAINAALQADAQADTDRLNEGPAPYANDDPKDKRFKTFAEYQANQAARAVMYDANRVEPDPENIARVARAIKEIGED